MQKTDKNIICAQQQYIEERLSGLATLAFKADEASKLNLKDVIKNFAKAKNRRKELKSGIAICY